MSGFRSVLQHQGARLSQLFRRPQPQQQLSAAASSNRHQPPCSAAILRQGSSAGCGALGCRRRRCDAHRSGGAVHRHAAHPQGQVRGCIDCCCVCITQHCQHCQPPATMLCWSMNAGTRTWQQLQCVQEMRPLTTARAPTTQAPLTAAPGSASVCPLNLCLSLP
jgi:hypothetical protein